MEKDFQFFCETCGATPQYVIIEKDPILLRDRYLITCHGEERMHYLSRLTRHLAEVAGRTITVFAKESPL